MNRIRSDDYFEDGTPNYQSLFSGDYCYRSPPNKKLRMRGGVNTTIDNKKFKHMKKCFFIIVMDETIKQVFLKESKNKDILNVYKIFELDWLSILNNYSSFMLQINGPLKRSKILNILNVNFNLVKNSGIIGNFSVEPSGVCEFSDRPEYIESAEGNVRYIKFLLKYNS